MTHRSKACSGCCEPDVKQMTFEQQSKTAGHWVRLGSAVGSWVSGRKPRVFLILVTLVLPITFHPVSEGLTAPDSLKTACDISIILPPSLEPQRGALTSEVHDAIDSTVSFFTRLGFKIGADSVIDTAYIFATVASARSHCATRFGVPETSVPNTFGGTVDGHVLLAASPGIYRGTFEKLYGTGQWNRNEYHKLLVHELAHRIHARIAVDLFGSEDGMGPRWFFEGLAIKCAGQFDTGARRRSLGADELRHYIEQDDLDSLPSPVYPIYRRMFDAAASQIPIHSLISHAGDSSFVTQLLQAFKRDTK